MDVQLVTGSPPSPFSNHVVIERTQEDTFRFEGVSNALGGEPKRYYSRHFSKFEAVKVAAIAWATQNSVETIYLS